MKRKVIITLVVIIIILFLISLPFIPSKDRKLEKEYPYLKNNLYEDYRIFKEGDINHITSGEINLSRSEYKLYCKNGEEAKEIDYYLRRYISCIMPKIGMSCSKDINVLSCDEKYWVVRPHSSSSGPFKYTWYGPFEK